MWCVCDVCVWCVYVYVCVPEHMHVVHGICVSVHIHVHMYVCMCVYMYVCVYVSVYCFSIILTRPESNNPKHKITE